MHQGDVRWGLAYSAQVQWPADPNEADLWVLTTIERQAIKPELIRPGHLPPADLVERQLDCLVRVAPSAGKGKRVPPFRRVPPQPAPQG
jgi:hypothetical protein